MNTITQIVVLNVGGTLFHTSRTTLENTEGFLRVLIQSSMTSEPIFIDRDCTHFRFILNRLRGSNILPTRYTDLQELQVEADFYNLTAMVDDIGLRLEHTAKPLEETIEQLRRDIRRT